MKNHDSQMTSGATISESSGAVRTLTAAEIKSVGGAVHFPTHSPLPSPTGPTNPNTPSNPLEN
jgi:hypothetical protein